MRYIAASLAYMYLAVGITANSHADLFGSGTEIFEIEFANVGHQDNPSDDILFGLSEFTGSVPYTYRISKYEISETMVNIANAESSIAGDPLNISHDKRGNNKPATSITWPEAALFVNWLNTSTDSEPAYKFDVDGNFQLWEPADAGYDPDNLFRNRLSKYYLPSIDEWHKAAYYDPVDQRYNLYPTGSDTLPISVASGTQPDTAVWQECHSCGPADIEIAGGLSSYGTSAQGGNVFEWQEGPHGNVSESFLSSGQGRRAWVLSNRVIRGGYWEDATDDRLCSFCYWSASAMTESNAIGFRVASIMIPEPSSQVILVCGFLSSYCLLRFR